ncbi:MAG TPA: proline--tRNA ligase, partial [Helicobacteraceae bacterium]|nr:proline--tRNA ligase [Helicobacteraceae bacterium]
RGCDQLQEVKAANAVNALDIEDVTEEELTSLGLVPGFMGPLGLEKVRIVFDDDLRGAKNLVCGANEYEYHHSGVTLDDTFDFAALYEAEAGDGCPHCDAKLTTRKGIEVGHIFKLGTTYSKALKAEFLNDKGQATPFEMGTYGMGVSRLVASVIEQHHDEKGCIWTKETAPYVVNVMVSNIKDEAQMTTGEALYTQLKTAGVEAILDDRKERFGFKMKDAELIGFPFTVIIGKELVNGTVQIMNRATLEKTDVRADEIYERLMELL